MSRDIHMRNGMPKFQGCMLNCVARFEKIRTYIHKLTTST